MKYLNLETLTRIDPKAYRATRPFPWLNPEGCLTDEGYERLMETLPDVSQFERVYGVARSHGQQPHDRFNLEYDPSLELQTPWREFIDELTSGPYHDALCRLIGARAIDLRFHWHYQPAGCSVSPHCDSKKKIGSHLFYLNRKDEWDEAWGGQTLILDDNGRFPRDSAPAFEDFDRVWVSKSAGNRSLLFSRSGNSWHGVREIRCPEGTMRRVFIVVLKRVKPLQRFQRMLPGRRAA